MTEPISRAERTELISIVKQRARLARQDVEAREAQIRADAEAALALEFEREDAAWQEMVRQAEQVVAETNRKVQAICEELGVPKKFRPAMGTFWLSRGENSSARRRAELRSVVRSQAEASAKSAKLEIDRTSVGIQERLMAGALTSEAAQAFLAELPTPAQLMPALDLPAAIGGGPS